MQDIHSIGPGGRASGTLFDGAGGAAGGGDRRVKLTNHPNLGHRHHNQALKCPRCDSLNTKFCYYNNYNFAQPRHFCKSCRRYWTNGGVLRNVPVGGGCRKSKRSSKSRHSTNPSISATISPAQLPPPSTQPTSNSHSSSESSSLAATTNMNTNSNINSSTAVDVVSGYSSSPNGVVGGHGRPGLGLEPNECGIFPDQGSSFTSLVTSSTNETFVPFGSSNLLNHPHPHQEQQQLRNHEDQTAEFMGMEKGSEGFGVLDWQTSGWEVGDQGIFDLPVISGVDQVYWSQSQWTTDQDHDHSNLYLP